MKRMFIVFIMVIMCSIIFATQAKRPYNTLLADTIAADTTLTIDATPFRELGRWGSIDGKLLFAAKTLKIMTFIDTSLASKDSADVFISLAYRNPYTAQWSVYDTLSEITFDSIASRVYTCPTAFGIGIAWCDSFKLKIEAGSDNDASLGCFLNVIFAAGEDGY